ncbi:ATP-binding protein [Penaeicola halotolerans]|uniref:ATP-binding protein n=1 Tax=Penaeicola halotolerans TaxID=2793196 RepID=UPI001CF85417|nr:ATP-binding protein [Penaeicola halotolerans]
MKRFFRMFDEMVDSQTQQTNLLESSRKQMIFFASILALLICLFPLKAMYELGLFIHFFRVIILLLVSTFSLYWIIKTGRYRLQAHLLLSYATLYLISNMIVVDSDYLLVGTPLLGLLVISSFFVLGLKWGLFYTIINVIPAIINNYLLWNDLKPTFSFAEKPILEVEIFISIAVFAVLIICLNLLQRAFFKTNLQLNEALENQKLQNKLLIDAKKNAEALAAAKTNFLSVMSHEIRTPLNAVVGLSGILLENSQSEEQKEDLTMLKFSAENLLLLINNILDFNKLESGGYHQKLRYFDLVEMVKSLISTQDIINEKSLKIKLEVDPEITYEIYTDPILLLQVIHNLLNNAIKFTDNGHVKVIIKENLRNEESTNLFIMIEDTGIGIPADKIELLFKDYAQVYEKEKLHKYGGTGLGLAIVKKILDILGTNIYVKSEEGKGTMFFFEMSMPYRFPVENKELISDQVIEKPLHVLIAEDNQINVLVIKKHLKSIEATFDIAENGLEALEMSQRKIYDVILMDIQMPEMDGIEASTMIRKDPQNPNQATPIIALTAVILDDHRDQMFAAGITDMMTKPFNFIDLKNMIYKSLRA